MAADPSPVRLLQVPYDSGVFGARMGAGPAALARAWAAQRAAGHADAVEEVCSALLPPVGVPS